MKARLEGLGSVMPSTETSAPGAVAVTVKANDAAGATAVVTTTLPAATGAVAGTVVVIEVELLAAMVAATPPMVTVAPVSPVPLIVTRVFTEPEAGDTELMVGAAAGGGAFTVNAKVAAGVTLVVTTILPGPTDALLGTVVIICVPMLLPGLAGAPPIRTEVAPPKLAPLMVTVSPGAPLVGETLDMVGGEVETGGGVTPHPPVTILRAPPVKVTVTALAAVHVTPLTVVVCA